MQGYDQRKVDVHVQTQTQIERKTENVKGRSIEMFVSILIRQRDTQMNI